MLLLWSIPLGILIGYLRGGRLSQLAQINLNATWLVLLALIIQLLIFPVSSSGPILRFGTTYFHVGSYVLLLAFVIANWRQWGIVVMAIGMALNLAVIAANGGYMPTTPALLRMSGHQAAAAALAGGGAYGNSGLLGPETRLAFLSDRFGVPSWVPLSNVFSCGDVVLALGLIYFLQAGMTSPRVVETA